MAIETSGFNLAIPQAPIVTPALTNLAPLNISAPGVAMQPAKIQTPSTAVSEGIALGLGAIGKGITAAYQNTQEEKKAKAQENSRQQELQLKQQEIAANRSSKLQTLGMEQARLGMEGDRLRLEQNKFDQSLDLKKQQEDFKERYNGSMGGLIDIPNAATTTPAGSNAIPNPSATPAAPAPSLFGTDPDTSYLKAAPPVQQIPANLGQNDGETTKALGYLNNLDIFSPTTIRYMSAENVSGPGDTPALPVPSQEPEVTPTTAPALSVLPPVNSIDAAFAAQQEKALSGIQSIPIARQAPETEAPQPNEQYESLIRQHSQTGGLTEQAANALSDYYKKTYGVDLIPTIVKNRGFGLDITKAQEQLKTKKVEEQAKLKNQQSGEQAQLKHEETRKRISRLDQAGLAAEVKDYNADPMVQVMNKRPAQVINFMPVAEAALSGKPGISRRVTDLAAIDEFVTFARGTQPTEAQYGEIQNYTQGYLNDLRQKIDKGTEGARLSPDDIKTMKNLMMETYNNTAMTLNGEIGDLKSVVQKNHPDIMTQQLPREYPILETKGYYEQEAGFASAAARQAHKKVELAAKNNDASAHKVAMDEYNNAIARLKKANDQAKSFEGEDMPANWEKWVKGGRGGWRRGMFGGVSDIGAAGDQSNEQ